MVDKQYCKLVKILKKMKLLDKEYVDQQLTVEQYVKPGQLRQNLITNLIQIYQQIDTKLKFRSKQATTNSQNTEYLESIGIFQSNKFSYNMDYSKLVEGICSNQLSFQLIYKLAKLVYYSVLNKTEQQYIDQKIVDQMCVNQKELVNINPNIFPIDFPQSKKQEDYDYQQVVYELQNMEEQHNQQPVDQSEIQDELVKIDSQELDQYQEQLEKVEQLLKQFDIQDLKRRKILGVRNQQAQNLNKVQCDDQFMTLFRRFKQQLESN